jgi:TolB-like protein/Tfp pilus assembly protein PilF
MSLVTEFKRRKVFRVAAVYAATAFVILQAADIILPGLGVPDWAMSLVVALTLLGFPVALVLGWALELTPDGLRVTPRPTQATAVGAARGADPAWLGRRTVVVVAVLLVFGAGLSAGWFLRPAGTRGAALTAAGPITVAVLPFQNLAGDAATEPFVLGVHDDLLTQLSRIQALRVISRTSVMEYRDSPKNIRQIAAELGAGAVVEGGVQRAGDRVRLNVQLIDARTDAHLWAETYDRALTAEDVFTIQADIARSVARALQAELAPAEQAQLDDAPTANLAALETYHAGRNAFFGRDTREAVALRMFERAVELDSEFADAWAGLASARSWQIRNGAAHDTTSALAALDRARVLAPHALSTRLAEAYFHYYARADLPRARAAFQTVYRAAPGSIDAVAGLAAVERRLGRMTEASELFRQATLLDPRNPSALNELAWTLAYDRRPAEAVPLLERALRLDPEMPNANLTLFGLLLWELGDTAGARRFAEQSLVVSDTARVGWREELALVRRDWSAAADAARGLAATGFWEYGGYYAVDPALRLARVAYLSGDAAALKRATDAALAAADSLVAAGAVPDDRWGNATANHLRRALAHAFRGDTARAHAAADQARRYPRASLDVLTGRVVLDHLVIVDILTGRHRDAIDGIERLLAVPSPLKPARLRLDPIYDPLRGDPRFQALAREDS